MTGGSDKRDCKGLHNTGAYGITGWNSNHVKKGGKKDKSASYSKETREKSNKSPD
jgi:hypothetical protein